MLGQRGIGICDGHPPDAILPERQGKPGELPLEPGSSGGLGREQRQLLTGRRGRAVHLQGKPGDRRGRWDPLKTREQEALDRLGVGCRLGESLLDIQLGRCPRPGECEIQVKMQPRP